MDTQPLSKTTPRDFFLWLGAIIGFYGSITSFISLLFSYINHLFPDALAYAGDPYGGAVRISMAALIVLVPTTILLMHLLRKIIISEPGKADIWVRRWALGLTLFIAALTVVIDLVTLFNTFLGGEISIRFALKVLVVLVVALWVFFHTYLDRKGYWIRNLKHAMYESVLVSAVVAVAIIAGFFIIGTPGHVRQLKLDDERVSDLMSIQSQVTYYYQQKQKLPQALSDLEDPLSGYSVPADPETKASYRYETTGPLSFKLCASFKVPAEDQTGRGSYGGTVSYPMPAGIEGTNWQHGAGVTCFDRTIDPDKFPSIRTTPVKPL